MSRPPSPTCTRRLTKPRSWRSAPMCLRRRTVPRTLRSALMCTRRLTPPRTWRLEPPEARTGSWTEGNLVRQKRITSMEVYRCSVGGVWVPPRYDIREFVPKAHYRFQQQCLHGCALSWKNPQQIRAHVFRQKPKWESRMGSQVLIQDPIMNVSGFYWMCEMKISCNQFSTVNIFGRWVFAKVFRLLIWPSLMFQGMTLIWFPAAYLKIPRPRCISGRCEVKILVSTLPATLP